MRSICKRFAVGLRIAKFVYFLLNCLFHFSYVLLNEPNDKNNKFLKKYFNFNNGNGILSDTVSREFWGIKPHNSKGSLIELIMKQDYFDGLNQLDN